MNIVSLEPTWQDLIADEWLAALDQTTFLTRCRTGAVSLTELQRFLVQHYHYSRHFTRYLCALLSNIANDGDRFELSENLFEEMGLGELGDIPHSQIYREMLHDFGLNPEAETILPATQDLIQAMFRFCRDPEPLSGLGALCIGTEAIVPHIYSQVVHGFRRHGIAESRLLFFTLHIEGDDEHALTMRRIIDRDLGGQPDNYGPLCCAAQTLIEKRAAFFEAISQPHCGTEGGLYVNAVQF